MNIKLISTIFSDRYNLNSEIMDALSGQGYSIQQVLDKAIGFVEKASNAIMGIYSKVYHIEIKDDKTPVTEADLISNKIITEGLKTYFSGQAILSEETDDDLNRLNNDFCWIIDPIDGTKGFIQKCGQFIINLALSYKGKIIVAVAAAPAFGEVYFAVKGSGAFLKRNDNEITRISTSNRTDNLILYTHNPKESNMGYRKLQEFYGNKVSEMIESHSRIKGCWIASGQGDVYASTAPMKEWDIAPQVLIVEEAGGIIRYADHQEINFNQEDPFLKHGIYIVNSPENIPELLDFGIEK